MYQIAVCDDERIIREGLEQYLRKYGDETGTEFETHIFQSADELLMNYPVNLDLIFLDIKMEGVDGMTAARRIRSFDSQVCIIFITTMYQCAIEGYAVRAFGFIRKPVSYAEIRHELTGALAQICSLNAREHFITIKGGGTTYRHPVSRISYCEVRRHAMRICIGGETGEYRCSMKALEECLMPLGFFKCHASYLVNGDYIQKIELNQLMLLDGTQIPISQRRRKEFLASVSSYIGGRI